MKLSYQRYCPKHTDLLAAMIISMKQIIIQYRQQHIFSSVYFLLWLGPFWWISVHPTTVSNCPEVLWPCLLLVNWTVNCTPEHSQQLSSSSFLPVNQAVSCTPEHSQQLWTHLFSRWIRLWIVHQNIASNFELVTSPLPSTTHSLVDCTPVHSLLQTR